MLPGLKHLYRLEDSNVLAIRADAAEIGFKMDFVLTVQHPGFQPPGAAEDHCYRRGTLRFPHIAHVIAFRRLAARSQDATGEADLGNIDSVAWRGPRCRLEGDWGYLELICAKPVVMLA